MDWLAVVIQHHPARAHLLPALAKSLEGLRVQVVTDPGADDPRWSAWRAYLACVRAAVETEAAHVLIVQDDAVPCPGFAEAAPGAIAAKSDRIVCFYVGGGRVGLPLRLAAQHCAPWAALDQRLWLPLVATSYPRVILEELLVWAEQDYLAQKSRADDSMLGRFLRAKNYRAWATVPNLVQHPDTEPSLVRRRAAKGIDPHRKAVCYIDSYDPRQILW